LIFLKEVEKNKGRMKIICQTSPKTLLMHNNNTILKYNWVRFSLISASLNCTFEVISLLCTKRASITPVYIIKRKRKWVGYVHALLKEGGQFPQKEKEKRRGTMECPYSHEEVARRTLLIAKLSLKSSLNFEMVVPWLPLSWPVFKNKK
jgi:hypothetical protein